MNINSTIESLHTNDNFKSELYHRLSGITIFFFWLRLYRGPTSAENILVGADVTASAGMPRNPTNRKPGIYLDMAGPGVAMRLRPPKCLVVQPDFYTKKNECAWMRQVAYPMHSVPSQRDDWSLYTPCCRCHFFSDGAASGKSVIGVDVATAAAV